MRLIAFCIFFCFTSNVLAQKATDNEISILSAKRQKLISEIEKIQNSYQNDFNSLAQDIADSLQISFQVNTRNKRDSLRYISQEITELINANLSARLDKLLDMEETFFAFVKFPGKIRNSNSPDSDIISEVGKTDTLLVINYMEGYYKVKLNNGYGYINEMFIQETPDILMFKKQLLVNNEKLKSEIEKVKAEFNVTLKSEEKYWNLPDEIEMSDNIYPVNYKDSLDLEKTFSQILKDKLVGTFGKETGDKLYSGTFWIGMTTEMVKAKIGLPQKITKSIGSWGISETWVYDGSLNLYFENGILNHYFTTSDL